ncbi:MAG: FHA domain-containing protein, partial [Myxococcales bacterium]|nr:FHA domain-containing protein [Myxococcales bacterium]
ATIRDLGSKNGVRIGDVAVDVAPLHDGDEVRLGELCLTFEHHGARIDTLLRRSGEPTVRRVRQPEPELAPRAPTRQPSLLPPLLAAAAFALILAALLLT